jgi:hypothetical protein
MSHEIIYDKSYLKGNDELKSFDLTDSIISGICSKSSRPEDSDQSCTNTSKTSTTSTISTTSSTKSSPSSEPSSTTSSTTNKSSSTSSTTLSSESTLSNSCIDNKSSTTSSTTLSNKSCDCSSSTTPTSTCGSLSHNTSCSNKSISKTSKHKPKHHTASILPARADPFVYDRKDKIIRYNFGRCISSGAALILGGNDGTMTFDPANGNIVTGKNNKLHNSTNSSIIGSSGVKLKNAKNTIVLGVKATDGDEFPEDLDQTLLVRNIHIAGNLRATNIIQNSVYVAGNSQHDVYHQITKNDGVDIIYVNPIDGIIWVQLGTVKDTSFESDRTLVIKDVSLETGKTSANNVHVVVSKANNGVPQTRIEYYNEKGNLVVSSDNKLGGYILNTAGGSVTYRYVVAFMPGQSATWMIQNQFIGNRRISPFPETDSETRSRLIKKY